MQRWKWQNERVVRFLKLLEPTNMLRKYAQEENSLLLNRSNMKEMVIHYESYFMAHFHSKGMQPDRRHSHLQVTCEGLKSPKSYRCKRFSNGWDLSVREFQSRRNSLLSLYKTNLIYES